MLVTDDRDTLYLQIRSSLDAPRRLVVDPATSPRPSQPDWQAPIDRDGVRILLARCGRLACAIAAGPAVEFAAWLWDRHASWARRDIDEHLPDRAAREFRRLLLGTTSHARIEWLMVELHAASDKLRHAPAGPPWRDAMQRRAVATLINAWGVLGENPRDATMWCVLEAADAAREAGFTHPDHWLRSCWWPRVQARLQFRDVPAAAIDIDFDIDKHREPC